MLLVLGADRLSIPETEGIATKKRTTPSCRIAQGYSETTPELLSSTGVPVLK